MHSGKTEWTESGAIVYRSHKLSNINHSNVLFSQLTFIAKYQWVLLQDW